MTDERAQAKAAAKIGELVNRILALAPEAGISIGIKIEPARKGKQR